MAPADVPAIGPVEVIDYHTAGEPFRIVVSGAPEMPGSTILDRRAHLAANADEVRRLLINEPRGHADQYGCYVTNPDDDGAAFGVVFFHKDGYSTACGHGTIAVATWAAEHGVVEVGEGTNSIDVDVPSGRVKANIEVVDGRVTSVAFVNVPAFVSARSVEVPTSRGQIHADISYGGAFYASVEASSLGLEVGPPAVGDFIASGREIKRALADHPGVNHPGEPRLSGLYGVIFFDHLGDRAGELHQRNITVFADGEVDRSPCGSGTSARLAILDEDGSLERGRTLMHDSVIGSRFKGKVVGESEEGLITEIRGAAYETGRATFTLDPRDELGLGFQLR